MKNVLSFSKGRYIKCCTNVPKEIEKLCNTVFNSVQDQFAVAYFSVEKTDEQRKLYIKDKILSQGRKISEAKKFEQSQMA